MYSEIKIDPIKTHVYESEMATITAKRTCTIRAEFIFDEVTLDEYKLSMYKHRAENLIEQDDIPDMSHLRLINSLGRYAPYNESEGGLYRLKIKLNNFKNGSRDAEPCFPEEVTAELYNIHSNVRSSQVINEALETGQ